MNVAVRERLSSRVVSGRRPGPQAGFTLLEVMMAATVMVVGLMGFLQVMVLSIGSSSANREADLATDAARQQIEVIQATNFRDIFRMFNDAPGDDPGAFGSAPGANFAVPGLDPDPADPDGLVGRIDLPSVDVGNGVQHLREDFQDSDLGMPRDLTGDGVWNDMLDHSGDYQLLPVVVRLRWRGATGISRMEFRTVIAEM